MPQSTMSTNLELVKLVRSRPGSGVDRDIYCAAGIVRRIAEELGKTRELKSAIKRAGKRLAIGGAVVQEKVNDVKSLNKLLPKEAVEAGVEFPPNTLMGFVNKITTPSEDRERDILKTAGAIPAERMPTLWQHLHTQPIGVKVHTLEHTPEVLRVATALLDLNQITHDCAILIEADAMGISHGFRALEWEDRKGPDGKKPSQPGAHGFLVTKFEIMEQSVVSVPCNLEAEIELWSRGKLKSAEVKAHAKALKDSKPLSLPVNIDLSLNGHRLNGSVNGGKKNGRTQLSLEVREQLRAALTQEFSRPEKIQEVQPGGEKSYGMCMLDGSWEEAQCQLCGTAQAFLQASGAVPDIGYRYTWVVGTFDGEAILCAEARPWQAPDGTEEYLYYRAAWSMGDGGMASFSGQPEKVELSLTVKALERSPLHKMKHPEPADEAGQRFVVAAANDEACLRKYAGVVGNLLGAT